MKKILVICAALLMGAGVCMADNKTKAGKTMVTTVFCTDIDCDHCKAKIMNNIPVLGKGVEDVQVDVATKKVTVTYDSAKNSADLLIKAFAKIKVKAEVEKSDK